MVAAAGIDQAVIPSDAIDIDTSQSLGSGAVGVVYKAKQVYANETVVVKRLRMQSISASAVEEFKREAATLSSLNHPRIVRLLGVVVDNNQYSIVLEYLPLGSLYNFYNDTPKLPYPNRLSLATDVATGMAFLHKCEPPVMHRDLKSLNLLLYVDAGGELHCKISDFGIALVREATLTTTSALSVGTGEESGQKGTLIWMAPELHNLRAVFRPHCDVYSYGVVLSELFSWVGPFGIPTAELRYEVLHRMLTIEKQVPEVELDPDVPSTVLRLVERCLNMDMTMRPSFQAIVKELMDVGRDVVVLGAEAVGAGGGGGGGAVVETVEYRVTQTDVSERSNGSDPSNRDPYHRMLPASLSTGSLSEPPSTPTSVGQQPYIRQSSTPPSGTAAAFPAIFQAPFVPQSSSQEALAPSMNPSSGLGYPASTPAASPAGYPYTQNQGAGWNHHASTPAASPASQNQGYAYQQAGSPPYTAAMGGGAQAAGAASMGFGGSMSSRDPSSSSDVPLKSTEVTERKGMTTGRKIIIGALAALVVVGAGVGGYLGTRPKTNSDESSAVGSGDFRISPTASTTATSTAATSTAASAPLEFV
ncbi:hypothetical protein HDU67_003854 [Dinochytrium kinnereticum]|nr:hypothetical protein HDU67_003854 [Dinochytrium kinnereticum]